MNRRNIGNVYGEYEGERGKGAGGVISGAKEGREGGGINPFLAVPARPGV